MIASLGGASGLVVTGWFGPGGPLLIVDRAAYPRFSDDGRLVVDVGADDGRQLHWSTTWVLDPRSTDFRPAHTGEALPEWSPPSTATSEAETIKICVDAGHGGSDGGAAGNGLLEKDVNLDVALRLADLLDADTIDVAGGGSWSVLLTRATDVLVSLQQRVTLANSFGAASFVSIHSNAFGDPSANGTETYAWAEGTSAAALRDRVHANMLAAWTLADRGTKTAGFYVLVNTLMAASLSELGFITNAGDAAFLGDPEERQKMALAHLFALQEHHGCTPYEPGSAQAGGTLKGILYDSMLGTGAPIAGGTVALSDGAFTTTDAQGFYSFVLDAGVYAFAATAQGFDAGQAIETVSSGDVWESLGLAPSSLPVLELALTGNELDVDISGDRGGIAWLLFATTPGLPLLGVGLKGVLWPDAASMAIISLMQIPPGGTLHLDIVLPSLPGIDVHCQAVARHQGLLRLSNGAAFSMP
jgi:N-acetylmuramoyl-L-alanine amidase